MAQTKSKETNLGRLFKNGDIFLVAGIFATVMLMIVPVHPFILDGLLAVSIALSLLIMLAILYIKDPAEFTGFPTLLLFITLFQTLAQYRDDALDPAEWLCGAHY